jgi:hypothetical protein
VSERSPSTRKMSGLGNFVALRQLEGGSGVQVQAVGE